MLLEIHLAKANFLLLFVVMDIQLLYFPIFLSLFLFLFMVFQNRNQKLPPGPWKLPLIGNMHQLAVSSLIHQTLRDLAIKHGPFMYLKIGQVPTIVVSSPEFAKQVMRTHDANLASRPLSLLSRIVLYDSKDLVFAPEGEYWRRLRKICVQEALCAPQVQSYRPIREEAAFDLVRRINDASDELEGSSSINFSKMTSLSTYVVTSRTVLGKESKDCEEFRSMVEGIVEFGARLELSEFFPSLGFLALISPLKREFEKLHQKSDRILENIIKEHNKEKKSAEKSCGKTEDLIDVLLRFHDNSDRLGINITNESVKGVIWDVFAAGSETSATATDWAMAEMITNPRVMKKAQQEVRKVFGRRGSVDEAGIKEMTYLKCVVKETLRLHPPLPLLLPRESRDECEISGYKIPPKTRFIINAWAIGRDPKYWTDPESFIPERFLDIPTDLKGNDFEFLPFGSGRRMCPGLMLGLINIELPLAFLLYHFDWKLPNGEKHEDLDMTEQPGMAIRRKYDLHLIPTVHDSSPLAAK